jgi:predicted PurR-regulated permease PerM
VSDPSASSARPDLSEARASEHLASGDEDHFRFLRTLIVSSALRVLAGSIILVVAALLAWRLRVLLLLLFVSAFVAALLNPFVRMIVRRGIHRTVAIFIVYTVLAILTAGIGFVVFHPLISSGTRFAKDLPTLVRQAQHGKGQVGRLVARLHLASYIQSHAPELESAISRLGKPALAVGKTVVGGVASIVTIMFLSLFMLLEVPKIVDGSLSLVSPEHALLFRRIIDAISRQVTGFMIGDFSTSIIAGVVVFFALRITGVPFATVLAVWVGLVDFLPLVGGLLAGVPTVGVAFLHSVPAGLIVIVVFLVYQELENHVLYPIIVSRTVRLNPLWVLLAVLIGAEVGVIIGSTFGALCGAILAVPAAGSIQVGGREYLRVHPDGPTWLKAGR